MWKNFVDLLTYLMLIFSLSRFSLLLLLFAADGGGGGGAAVILAHGMHGQECMHVYVQCRVYSVQSVQRTGWIGARWRFICAYFSILFNVTNAVALMHEDDADIWVSIIPTECPHFNVDAAVIVIISFAPFLSLSLSLTFLPFEVACSRSHEMFQKLFDSMHAIPLSIFA